MNGTALDAMASLLPGDMLPETLPLPSPLLRAVPHAVDLDEPIVPAPLQFGCDQAVIRIDGVILPPRQPRLVARLGKGEFGLPMDLGIVGRTDIDRMQSGLDPQRWLGPASAELREIPAHQLRFAPDSPVEEAVSSEPVSEAKFPC